MEFLDRLEANIQKLTLYELIVGSIGLIIGLVIANLIVFNQRYRYYRDTCGHSREYTAGCLGVAVAAGKKMRIY